MWVFTMARRSDGRTFLLDLDRLGIISMTGPHAEGADVVWAIEASDGSVSWVLAEAPNQAEAQALQRKIFNSIATGERALNLNARKQPVE